MNPQTSYSQNFPTLLEEANQRASRLASTSGQLASELPNIGTLLKQRAYDAYSQNQDIVNRLDTATSSYLTSPQVAREKFQGIFNPFTREKLVSQSVANTALPMLSLSSILGNRMGRIEDIIGTGTNAFQAQVAAQQAQAQAAQQSVENLLKQYSYETEAIKANKPVAGDAGLSQLTSLLNSILSGQNQNDQQDSIVDPSQFDDLDISQETELPSDLRLPDNFRPLDINPRNSSSPSIASAQINPSFSPNFDPISNIFSGIGNRVGQTGSDFLKWLAYAGG